MREAIIRANDTFGVPAKRTFVLRPFLERLFLGEKSSQLIAIDQLVDDLKMEQTSPE